MVECHSGGASEIRDPHVASRRQTDRQLSSCWDDSRLLVWSMPVSLSDASTHTHKHTYSFFISCTIKQNTFFFLCVSMNIKTRRHFPQAGYCEIYMATKKHLDTSARLQNVCISLYYINTKPRAFFKRRKKKVHFPGKTCHKSMFVRF